MCPLAEMSPGWGVETMSLPFCQPVGKAAQGNFRMSLCFGRLSSSSSPVILWSCQASCSLPHSLSPLMVSDGREDNSGLCRERDKSIPFTSSLSPRRAIPAVTSQPPSSTSSVRWYKEKKTPSFPQIQGQTSPKGACISGGVGVKPRLGSAPVDITPCSCATVSKYANPLSRHSPFRNEDNSWAVIVAFTGP